VNCSVLTTMIGARNDLFDSASAAGQRRRDLVLDAVAADPRNQVCSTTCGR
jgi:hypothetical protein